MDALPACAFQAILACAGHSLFTTSCCGCALWHPARHRRTSCALSGPRTDARLAPMLLSHRAQLSASDVRAAELFGTLIRYLLIDRIALSMHITKEITYGKIREIA